MALHLGAEVGADLALEVAGEEEEDVRAGAGGGPGNAKQRATRVCRHILRPNRSTRGW